MSLSKDFAKGLDDIVLTSIDANMTVGSSPILELDVGGTFIAGEIRQTGSGSNLLVKSNTDREADQEMTILLNKITGASAIADHLLWAKRGLNLGCSPEAALAITVLGQARPVS